MFKCLIFVQGLTAPKNSEIRLGILSKFKQNTKISQYMVAEEYERIENLRHDTARIEERDVSKINIVKKKKKTA